MPAEQRLLQEVARRTRWNTILGLWTEVLNPRRYKQPPPAEAQATPPDPPPPLIIYDLPVVINRDGEPMYVVFREPKNSPHPHVFSFPTTSSPPPPTTSSPPPPTTSSPPPPPPPPPITASVTDHASRIPIHSPPPPPSSSSGTDRAASYVPTLVPSHFDELLERAGRKVMAFNWRRGCVIGFGMLSMYLLWRCYRGWRTPGGDQQDGPELGFGAGQGRFHSRGIADALLEYDCSSIVFGHGKAVDDMVKVGEALFGQYEWEKFNLLVLPPNLPYGGLKNSKMIFLAPTMMKLDAAAAQMVAHELTNIWTGNIITNKMDEDLLTEGFTTYAERRIIEVLQGEEGAALNMGHGWKGMDIMLDRFKNSMESTDLKPKMAGIDPDDVFLWHIERQIGRPAFDEFLKKYIATFKFQSVDTETFLQFLKANVPGIENQIDLDVWIDGTGIPPDAMEQDSATYRKICTLAAEFKSGKIPSEDGVADWSGQEWELYLENLSTDVEASQVRALDERYKKQSESRDFKLKVEFLKLAIPMGCRCYFNEVENCLKLVGRMKYLRLIRQQHMK